MPKPRIDWSAAPLLFTQAPPPCPNEQCGSRRKPKAQCGPIEQGDGSRLHLLICRDCGQPRRVVEEPPEFPDLYFLESSE